MVLEVGWQMVFLTMDTTVAASTALRESTASVIPVLGANGSMDGSRGNTEYSWDSEYYEDESDYEPHDFGDFEWEHSPSPEYTTERACVPEYDLPMG